MVNFLSEESQEMKIENETLKAGNKILSDEMNKIREINNSLCLRLDTLKKKTCSYSQKSLNKDDI